ncbi:MAG: hypothetical protein HKN26_04880 [Acidimicrobiales bacterium]|nr:hypothetical protein [Acidimicrobiales bacterium]
MAVVVAAVSFGAAYAYALTSASPAAADCAGPTVEYNTGPQRSLTIG